MSNSYACDFRVFFFGVAFYEIYSLWSLEFPFGGGRLFSEDNFA